MVAYYLLTMLSRAFSSMPGLASGIARQIRNGEIKKFLIQPVDMIGFSAAQPHRPQAGLLLGGHCCRSRSCSSCAAVTSWTAGRMGAAGGVASASLILGFLLGFFLEATLG